MLADELEAGTIGLAECVALSSSVKRDNSGYLTVQISADNKAFLYCPLRVCGVSVLTVFFCVSVKVFAVVSLHFAQSFCGMDLCSPNGLVLDCHRCPKCDVTLSIHCWESEM